MFRRYIEGITANRYILVSLVQRDLLMKYRKSKLGVLWSILTPLGLAAVVGSVYAVLFGTSPKTLIPLIFSGLNPWLFMSGTADGATMTYPAAEGYIKQATVSIHVFPLRTTLTNFVTLLYSIITFFGIYLFLQPETFSPVMLMCIPGLLIMFVFSLGLANITSVVNLHMRDYAPLQSLAIQGLFYATPIIYDAQVLADKGFAIIYQINPFYYMLEVVRRPMLGAMPAIECYVVSIVIALIVFCASVKLQDYSRKKIVYML